MNIDNIAKYLGLSVKTLITGIEEMIKNGTERGDAVESFRTLAQLKKDDQERKGEIARKKVKKEEEEKIRKEENEILEKYRELFERRVKSFEPVCPKCSFACEEVTVFIGGSGSEARCMSCGNSKCSNFIYSRTAYDCDWESPLKKEDLKKKMFYNP